MFLIKKTFLKKKKAKSDYNETTLWNAVINIISGINNVNIRDSLLLNLIECLWDWEIIKDVVGNKYKLHGKFSFNSENKNIMLEEAKTIALNSTNCLYKAEILIWIAVEYKLIDSNISKKLLKVAKKVNKKNINSISNIYMISLIEQCIIFLKNDSEAFKLKYNIDNINNIRTIAESQLNDNISSNDEADLILKNAIIEFENEADYGHKSNILFDASIKIKNVFPDKALEIIKLAIDNLVKIDRNDIIINRIDDNFSKEETIAWYIEEMASIDPSIALKQINKLAYNYVRFEVLLNLAIVFNITDKNKSINVFDSSINELEKIKDDSHRSYAVIMLCNKYEELISANLLEKEKLMELIIKIIKNISSNRYKENSLRHLSIVIGEMDITEAIKYIYQYYDLFKTIVYDPDAKSKLETPKPGLIISSVNANNSSYVYNSLYSRSSGLLYCLIKCIGKHLDKPSSGFNEYIEFLKKIIYLYNKILREIKQG